MSWRKYAVGLGTKASRARSIAIVTFIIMFRNAFYIKCFNFNVKLMLKYWAKLPLGL